jgi:hypothetical protein
MEVRLVVFLAFASVTVVANTVAILLAYRLFSRMTTRVTQTVAEVQRNTATREWINSLQVAAERAAVVTQVTKVKFAEFEPILQKAQVNYRQSLVTIDSKLETTAERITKAARDVRDTISKPAFAIATFAAGLAHVIDQEEDLEEY